MSTRALFKTLSLLLGGYIITTLLLYAATDYFLKPKPPAPKEPTLLMQVDEKTDWIRGEATAPLTIVEYGDYQCPFCVTMAPLISEAQQELGGQVRFVFRHFPLDSHKNARNAALAAEAAGKQGKYWEMHEKLYATSPEWAETEDASARFEVFAQELGLNAEQFKADRDNEETARNIESDYYGGLAGNISSVPAFFVNGTYTKLPQTKEELISFLKTQTVQ